MQLNLTKTLANLSVLVTFFYHSYTPALVANDATCKESKYGGVIMGDSKDIPNFCYFTYQQYPNFTKEHTSVMSKVMTPTLHSKLIR